MSLTDIPHYGAETQTHTRILLSTVIMQHSNAHHNLAKSQIAWRKATNILISNSGKDLLKISKRVLNRNSVHQGQLQYFSRQTH